MPPFDESNGGAPSPKLLGKPCDPWMALKTQRGFGNEHETEALRGALPARNNPQRAPLGLYAEQYSGTAFTAPRATNRRTAPRGAAGGAARLEAPDVAAHEPCAGRPRRFDERRRLGRRPRGRLRRGSPEGKDGVSVQSYRCDADMVDKAYASADGHLLIVPERGALRVTTELGRLRCAPGSCLVVPRNVLFSVAIDGEFARGWVLETYAGAFTLPELGPIGANGLAEARDFEAPVAWYEDRECAFQIVTKFRGGFRASAATHSVFDVVAWRGTYAPVVYDLERFVPVNAVKCDHPDPSIFTVLTVPSATPGVPVADFVVFPERYACAVDTFRPPYFHKNVMSEFMGLIRGAYDGKGERFGPGCASLHGAGVPHGPDAETFAAASTCDTSRPAMLAGGLAFMFETNALLGVAPDLA
ncbi:homogentisate 1,2-dioxygenase [Aureococcus anophagefferens]|nr:homogentisate 1,2-dioxygenase [Aureococcus anophagefferens]